MSLAKRVRGEVSDLGLEQSFRVVPMTEGTLDGATPAERTAFVERLGEALRVANGVDAKMDELQNRIGSIERALMHSTVSGPELDQRVREMGDRLADHRKTLQGHPVKQQIGEPTKPGVMNRLQVAVIGNRFSLYGPTPSHLRSVEIAEGQLEELGTGLESLEGDLAALEEELEEAEVPWTPGRDVPEEGALDR